MNATFQVLCKKDGTYLKLIPATDDGESLDVGSLIDYLNYNRIDFQLPEVNQATLGLTEERVITLNNTAMLPIRECLITDVSEDHMECLAKFMPADSAKKVALTNRWAQLRPKIREGYDVECGNAFSGRLEALRQKEKDKGLLTEVQNFKDEISKWETEFVPSQNIRTNVLHGADELIQRIEDELDLRVGSGLQNQIDDMAKNAATKATVDGLEQLRQKVDGWEPYTDKGERRKCEIRKNLEDNKPRWEQTYLDNCCTTNADAAPAFRWRAAENRHRKVHSEQSGTHYCRRAYGQSGQ